MEEKLWEVEDQTEAQDFLGGGTSRKPNKSFLDVLRDQSRQLNEAMKKAMDEGYAVLEFTDVLGNIHRYYAEGNHWADRPNSMEAKYGRRKGTYKAQYEDR